MTDNEWMNAGLGAMVTQDIHPDLQIDILKQQIAALIEQKDDLKNACIDWQLDHQSMVLEIKQLKEKHQRDLHDWAIAHAEQLNAIIRATAEECAEIVMSHREYEPYRIATDICEDIAAAIRERFTERNSHAA